LLDQQASGNRRVEMPARASLYDFSQSVTARFRNSVEAPLLMMLSNFTHYHEHVNDPGAASALAKCPLRTGGSRDHGESRRRFGVAERREGGRGSPYAADPAS
jgi:hypothetical protein